MIIQIYVLTFFLVESQKMTIYLPMIGVVVVVIVVLISTTKIANSL